MNAIFTAFIDGARGMALRRGLPWDVPVEPDGSVPLDQAWDVTAITGAAPPPSYKLSNLGSDARTLTVLNKHLAANGHECLAPFTLPEHWRDLVKAVALRQVLVERNTAAHVIGQVVRPLRVLSTCVQASSGAEPWNLTADDVRFAHEMAKAVQPSGALANHLEGVIRGVLDARHLCDNGPLAHVLPMRERGTSPGPHPVQLRASLYERRSEDKLPGNAKLWMLVDIVFTRRPLTFLDKLRFAILRVLLLCGFRVSEACSIPADWERTQQHVDLEGRPAGLVGGVSSTMLIRHFAGKQQGADEDSALLTETFQHVPAQFEDILRGTLDEIRVLTEPLRRRLKAQVEAGRSFPEFPFDALIPLPDLYTRLTGNPVIKNVILDDEIAAYLRTFNEREMDTIAEMQVGTAAFRMPVHGFWKRWEDEGGPPLRTADGRVRSDGRRDLNELHALVADLERHVALEMRTKLSDTHPLPLLGGGTLPAYEMLFLMPKRAVSEGRNGGACDVGRYFSVGRLTSDDIIRQLSGVEDGLFARYGETEAERAYALNSHALRHLQNGELFRLGISDAAITKRFDRKGVVQSHVYDHRSLAEELEAMSLPPEADVLPEKARIVAKMIKAGRGRGAVVDEFKRIMREQGATVAYQFLAAEADGFHVTPYGFCVNGFTQEPCPKHLQCFNGCCHLVSTGNKRHQDNLKTLARRTEQAIYIIEGRKGGIGRDNQLAHARTVFENIGKILGTPAGEAPFPDGPDLSKLMEPRTVLDG